MISRLLARLREWVAVEDPEERIEGSGDPITSPQHRRAADAERMLEDSAALEESRRKRNRDR